jgi:pteridine reductase
MPASRSSRTIDGSRPVALVTGAARRVGLASALGLARAGCDVVITYLHSRADAERARDQLASTGAAARIERLDLRDLEGSKVIAAQLAEQLPRLDVLVHNASIYQRASLEQVTIEHLIENYRVHIAGPVLLTQGLAAQLRQSPLPGGGAIVCMCDIHALGRPRRNYLAYSVTKAALAEMVRSLAVELAPQIRVNGIAPGAVAFAESGPDADPEMQQRYLSRVPLARTGTPEEAAEAVRWLALDATYITGEIIRVDGGRWLR